MVKLRESELANLKRTCSSHSFSDHLFSCIMESAPASRPVCLEGRVRWFLSIKERTLRMLALSEPQVHFCKGGPRQVREKK